MRSDQSGMSGCLSLSLVWNNVLSQWMIFYDLIYRSRTTSISRINLVTTTFVDTHFRTMYYLLVWLEYDNKVLYNMKLNFLLELISITYRHVYDVTPIPFKESYMTNIYQKSVNRQYWHCVLRKIYDRLEVFVSRDRWILLQRMNMSTLKVGDLDILLDDGWFYWENYYRWSCNHYIIWMWRVIKWVLYEGCLSLNQNVSDPAHNTIYFFTLSIYQTRQHWLTTTVKIKQQTTYSINVFRNRLLREQTL